MGEVAEQHEPLTQWPLSEFWTSRRIEFSDTDLAGIVHFSRFFVFMETAEHELLNAVGTSVDAEDESASGTRRLGWPRLRAECEFSKPVRFEDTLDIRLLVKRKGRSSMTYLADFFHADHHVARGEMTSVCCQIAAGRPPRAVPIPDEVAERLEQASAERLESKSR